MPSSPRPAIPLLALAALLLAAGGCQTLPDPAPPTAELAALIEINAAVNRQGRPCPTDACLENWPDVADLERLDHWDCKAYVVAKADRLMRPAGGKSIAAAIPGARLVLLDGMGHDLPEALFDRIVGELTTTFASSPAGAR